MAQLDARTDDFIRMLLEVSGRARTADLHGVSPAEASSLLDAYAAAHPEQSFNVANGVLTVTAAPAFVAEPAPTATDPFASAAPAHTDAAPFESAPTPVPEQFAPSVPAPPAEPMAVSARVEDYAPAPAEPFAQTAQPFAPVTPASVTPEHWAPPQTPAPAMPAHEVFTPSPDHAAAPEIPAWVYEQPASAGVPAPAPPAEAFIPAPNPEYAAPTFGVPAAAPASNHEAAPTAFGVPAPAAAPAPEAAWQTPAPAWPAPEPAWPAPSEEIHPAGDWQVAPNGNPLSSREQLFDVEPPLEWYWWLLPIIFSLLGGFAAWLILRGKQPKAARKMLYAGVVVMVLNIVASCVLAGLVRGVATSALPAWGIALA